MSENTTESVRQITAYLDRQENLHRTRESAVRQNFVTGVLNAFAGLPQRTVNGGPLEIAKMLASPDYPNARRRLMVALNEFEMELGCMDGLRPRSTGEDQ